MRFPAFRSLYVHSWGGQASQMLAWNLYFILQEKFPNRKITFVHHNSGVTRREFGSEFKRDNKSVKSIDDYELELKRFDIVRKFRRFLSWTFVKLGFVSHCDSLLSVDKMHSWIHSTRGSYNNIPISRERLEQIFSLFDITIKGNSQYSNLIVIHYRLGDLLFLNSKSYVDRTSLTVLLDSLSSSYRGSNIELFSDSPQIARDLMESSQSHFNINFNQGDIKLIFEKGINAQIFIGSNSKISHLIALHRLYNIEPKVTFMPINQDVNIWKLVDDTLINNHLLFY